MWYMAVLVRGAHVDGVLDDELLGDKLYCLIEAATRRAPTSRRSRSARKQDDTYEDEDGVSVTVAFIGLADLTEIAAETLEQVEVYSQLIPKNPAEMVVTREELTVFETGDGEELEDDAERSG